MNPLTVQPRLQSTSILDILQERARLQGEETAFTFLNDDDTESTLTFRELDRYARAVGAFLQDQKAAGERVILAFPPGLPYVIAFYGCLYAGATAVPVYPPKTSKPDTRFEAILRDSDAKLTLTTTAIYEDIQARFQKLTPALQAQNWKTTDDLDLAWAERWKDPGITGDTLAFLQYTSGSTSLPKGVMVTHSNVLHNCQMIVDAHGAPSRSTMVSWLPMFHDMGLIGVVLHTVYHGLNCVMMSPLAFLQRPIRWLQAITRFQANLTVAPNFAYELCVRKIKPEQVAELDLSHLVLATSGAEPVRWDTVKRFIEHFAPAGFRPQASCPSYGMAETTLIVSGSPVTQHPTALSVDKEALKELRVVPVPADHPNAQILVGCGPHHPKSELRIVDPQTLTVCPPGRIGEIWVSGPHVARGYFNKPKETEETFHARIADTGEGPFLRTGDLGFVHEGELYISGRLKDLIIIRGQNHYPQDIEWTVENSHDALATDCTAAFSVEVNGEEQLVIATEVERQHRKGNLAEVAAAVQIAVSEHHGVSPYAVLILSPGGVPKTTSNKIQRRQTRELFLQKKLNALYVLLQGRHKPDWGQSAGEGNN
jgi:acyl-CoA synthetase (AMP-forming)/AMP-acid ligase II